MIEEKVVVKIESNGGKLWADTSERLKERLYDDVHESVSVYVVPCGVIGQNVGLRGLRETQRVRFVSIPDSVEELCESCFYLRMSLSCVTFGES